MAARELVKPEERIVTDPEILAGKPTIKGTRISVELVLGFLAEQPDLNELFAAYPHLTVEDVQACLAFAETLVEKNSHRKLSDRPKSRPHSAA